LTFRLSAAGAIAIACAAALYLAFGTGIDPIELARWLGGHDHAGYAAWLGWVVVAPVVLLAAAWAARRTPWPWVVAVTAHLAALVAGQARLAHLTDGWMWVVLAGAVGVGLTSIATVLDHGPASVRLFPGRVRER
jgi:hypothetical protein